MDSSARTPRSFLCFISLNRHVGEKKNNPIERIGNTLDLQDSQLNRDYIKLFGKRREEEATGTMYD